MSTSQSRTGFYTLRRPLFDVIYNAPAEVISPRPSLLEIRLDGSCRIMMWHDSQAIRPLWDDLLFSCSVRRSLHNLKQDEMSFFLF